MVFERCFFYTQVIFFAACVLLNGCGGEQWTYQPDRELKPGPGIISGQDGEFNLIGGPEKEEEGNKETQDSN